ncbi:MAG: hypothetical protein SchgKO_16320 [Schleiferiaceae bacterium]
MSGFNITKDITIAVPEDALWEMIGPGFVDVYKWSSNVDHASGTGTPEFEGAVCSERSCDLNVKGFSKISEKLTKYNAKTKTLAYTVQEGMPGFVTEATNEWTVVPVGKNASKLTMKARFGSKGIMGALMNGMMEKKMVQTLETVLNDAKVYAETGLPSKAKRDRMKQLALKVS